MATDKNIKITLTIDGIDKEIENVDQLEKELKDLGNETKKAGEQQGFFAKKTEELKDRMNSFKATLGEVGKGIKNGIKGLKGFVSGFKTAGGAVKNFGRLAKGAIAATGIGLLIVAVVSLIDYFKNLEGGAKTLQKIMAGLGAIVSNVAKAFSLVVKGKFSEAFDTLKNAVVEATEAVDDQFEAEKKLSQLRQRTIIENANLRKEIEKQKKILEDTTLSTEERLAALDKVTAATKQLALNQKAETEEALRAAQAELATIDNYEQKRQKQEEIAQLQADLIDQQTTLQTIEYDAARVAREIRQAEADEKQRLADEESARKQKEAEEAAALAQKKLDDQAKINEVLQQLDLEREEDAFRRAERELQIQEEKMMKEFEALGATEAEKAQLAEEFSAKRKQLAKEEADYNEALTKQTQEANLQAYSQGLGAIANLVGQNTAFGKAAAVASTTIDTYLGAQKAYTSQLVPGDPSSVVRASIAAGVAVANGIANVRSILKTQTPGGASAGGSTPSKPNIRTFDPTQTGAGTPTTTEGANVVTPQQSVVKAYVVSSDMTSQQEADKKINDLATL
jgi:hypothetical protein